MSDSCPTNRGVRTGVLTRLAKLAPQVKKCDIGGDGLHHIHNANKAPGSNQFPKVMNILNNVKYDIRASTSKVDNYKAACRETGEAEKMPAMFCQSRFLSRYEAAKDVNEHIETLVVFYENAKVPRKKKILGKIHLTASQKKRRTNRRSLKHSRRIPMTSYESFRQNVS